MIDGGNFFDHPMKNCQTTYDNTRKVGTGQGGDYATGCLSDYPYFKECYKIIAMDLSKQQALDDDATKIKQINFAGNLDQAKCTTM